MKVFFTVCFVMSLSLTAGATCKVYEANNVAAKAYKDRYGEKPDEVNGRFISRSTVAEMSLEKFRVVVDVNGGSGIYEVVLDGHDECRTLSVLLVYVD